MSKPLKYVAQQALDQFYQNYKSDSDFFDIDDAVDYAGNAVAQIYQKIYEAKYAEIRSRKDDEVVTFDVTLLSTEELKVERKGNSTFATLTSALMSFVYDNTTSSLQDVIAVEPFGVQLERSSLPTLWQQRFLPAVNKVFWYNDNEKINFIVKGNCNINKVRIYYIPEVNPNMLVPEGIVDDVIKATLGLMFAGKNGNVVKKSVDGNPNKVMESEINKESIK